MARTKVRHPKLRTKGIEVIRDLAPEVWAELTNGILELVETLPAAWRPLIKPEICGSAAFMMSRPWSDFDINLAVDGWRDLHQLDYVKNSTPLFRAKLLELQSALGCFISVACRTIAADSPEAPADLVGQYPIYSLTQNQFLNKVDYEIFPHTLRWDEPLEWWAVFPPKDETASFDSDIYEAEVEPWRTIYGEFYTDLSPYVIGS